MNLCIECKNAKRVEHLDFSNMPAGKPYITLQWACKKLKDEKRYCMVDGSQFAASYCYIARNDEALCGKEGKWFESC